MKKPIKKSRPAKLKYQRAHYVGKREGIRQERQRLRVAITELLK